MDFFNFFFQSAKGILLDLLETSADMKVSSWDFFCRNLPVEIIFFCASLS